MGRKPQNLTAPHAAALPLTGLTAWESLFDRLKVSLDPQHNVGKTLLVIGGAGGVGSVATQLARLYGLTVIATASTPESRQWVTEHGAHSVVDHRHPLGPQLTAIGCNPVNYILCLNDTAGHWEDMAEVIAPQGHICSIVEMDSPVDLSLLQTKSVTFAWEWMFTRSVYQTADQQRQHDILNTIAHWVEEGALQNIVTQQFHPINASTLREANARIERGHAIGKIVVEGWE